MSLMSIDRSSRKIILIAGMHRSGTSYLTKSLNLLGMQLPKSMRPGAPDNPKGHFESFRVSQYHENLLNDMGLSWDTFILPTDNWFLTAEADQAVIRLCGILKEDYSNEGRIVLKDPRISMLIPLWKNVTDRLGLHDCYVISFRHPFDVAASLHERNKISRTHALLIWLAYLFSAEIHSRGLSRSFLCFPDWVENIKLSIEKIEQDLEISLPVKSQIGFLQVRNEFEKSLVHHSADRTLATNQIERLALDVFAQFKYLVETPSDSEVLSALDKLYIKFQSVSMLCAELYADILQSEYLHSEPGKRVAQNILRLVDAENTRLKLKHESAMQNKNELDAKVTSLNKRIKEHEGRIVDLLMQLQNAVERKNELDVENNALKIRNQMLAKEFEEILLDANKQKHSVLRPIYRNIYRIAGFGLRMLFSARFVESLKKVVPDPSGVPKHLTYRHVNNKRVATPLEVFVPAGTTAVPDVIVLSIVNWDFRVQRPQHLAQGLAESVRRVFYIEMELEGDGLAINTISENLYRVRLSGKDIGHIQPYTGQPGVDKIEKWLDSFYQFCDSVFCTAFKQVVVQHPFWWSLARHLPPEYQIIFDCMDDISGFSNTNQFLLDLEHDLLSKCDKLVVSSQHLFNKYKRYIDPVLIRNAADTDHFISSSDGLECPDFLKDALGKGESERINVGYVGAIAEWFDTNLLKEVVEYDSCLNFHLCGAVTVAGPDKLEESDNVHMYGEISYMDVPGFINEMDVMIIPFKIIPIIEACDPVKFYEYSAMKKPTVATALPELSRAKDIVFEATTAKEFRQQIYNAFEKGKSHSFQEQLRNYARNNTWASRVADFNKMLIEAPRVSIVILSYGDHELAKGVVHSLYKDGPSYPNMEVIVVDNGSTNEALADLKEFFENYPNVSLVENGENLGFAKGNNVGLKAATGEYVMLLNNDTYVAPGAIFSMVRHLAHNPTIGVVGPLTNSIGNEAKLFVDYEDMDQMRQVARNATTGFRGVYTTISVVAYFAVMFRRKDLEAFGLLSEVYGRGMFEDDDHCAVIKSKGYLCALAEDAFVHHEHSATFSTMENAEKQALFESNKKIFENRWGADWIPHRYRDHRPIPSYLK